LLLLPPAPRWSAEGIEVCGDAVDGMISCRHVAGAAGAIHIISAYKYINNVTNYTQLEIANCSLNG